MREYDYRFCAAASKFALAADPDERAKPVPVRANDSFSAVRVYLAAGEGVPLNFVNVTFSGRVRGNGRVGFALGRAP